MAKTFRTLQEIEEYCFPQATEEEIEMKLAEEGKWAEIGERMAEKLAKKFRKGLEDADAGRDTEGS